MLARIITCCTMLWFTSACASTGLGISGDALPAELLPTYEQARLGGKQAQFELGVAFAEGDSVERDCSKARRLLGLAAADTGGTIWVYSPPVGNGTRGRVIPINQGPKQPGLKSAKELLSDPSFCRDGV